jgi:hypothetical protein
LTIKLTVNTECSSVHASCVARRYSVVKKQTPQKSGVGSQDSA